MALTEKALQEYMNLAHKLNPFTQELAKRLKDSTYKAELTEHAERFAYLHRRVTRQQLASVLGTATYKSNSAIQNLKVEHAEILNRIKRTSLNEIDSLNARCAAYKRRKGELIADLERARAQANTLAEESVKQQASHEAAMQKQLQEYRTLQTKHDHLEARFYKLLDAVLNRTLATRNGENTDFETILKGW